MKRRADCLILVALSLLGRASALGWQKQRFPHPEAKPNECRTITSKQFCDPDSLIGLDSSVEKLEDVLLQERRIVLSSSCRVTPARHTNVENAVAVQFAVALVRKMDLTNTGGFGSEERAGELFARHVHDTWGVGMDTGTCGGTGVLLFLSEMDRTVYISRGKALETVLTDDRLDLAVKRMKPLLQKRKYAAAILQAISEMDDWLQKGEPSFWESVTTWITKYMGLLLIAAFFVFAWWAARREEKQRQTYAEVASHLDELDRARAEALQGRFRAVSCPICLEKFPEPVEEGNGDEEDEDDKKDQGSETDSFMKNRKGSDGLPLKLLRCGHVFDETCWTEWVNSGRGNVDRCPICNQDVAGRSGGGTEATEGAEERAAPQDDGTADARSYQLSLSEQRMLRRYNRERHFRLMRMATRYPQFIRPQQIQRWTSSTYNGSLVRDQSFANSNPARQNVGHHGAGGTRSSGGSSFGGSGFGGGRSGGGRGGRW